MVEGTIENLTPNALQSDTKRQRLIECKSLGKSIINMYSMGACAALGISNQDALSDDLEPDPFLNSALQRFTCELYYRFGSFLAPFSVGLITSRNYVSERNKNEGMSQDNQKAK